MFSQHNNARAVFPKTTTLLETFLVMAGAGGTSAGANQGLQAAEVPPRPMPKQSVYLNTATTAELAQGLIGVGERRAEAIVTIGTSG